MGWHHNEKVDQTLPLPPWVHSNSIYVKDNFETTKYNISPSRSYQMKKKKIGHKMLNKQSLETMKENKQVDAKTGPTN